MLYYLLRRVRISSTFYRWIIPPSTPSPSHPIPQLPLNLKCSNNIPKNTGERAQSSLRFNPLDTGVPLPDLLGVRNGAGVIKGGEYISNEEESGGDSWEKSCGVRPRGREGGARCLRLGVEGGKVFVSASKRVRLRFRRGA